MTVPANALGANGSVRVEVWGDYLKNANIDMTFRGKFGGSTLLADTVAWGAVTGANCQPWKMEFELLNKGATNSQLLWLRLATVNANSPAPTTGIGELESLQHPLGLMNTAAIDTTVDQTLLISVQWASASASASWRRRWARSLIGRN